MSKLSSLISLSFILNSLLLSTTTSLMAQTENAATRDYAVALGFERKGHYPQAIGRWTAFVTQHPQDKRAAMAHYHLGNCYYQHQDFPNAAKTFQHVLSAYKTFPHRDAAEFNLALVFYHQASASTKPEDYKKAATAFSEMAKRHPKSQQVAQAGWYQAECLYQADDKPQAAAVYQAVINAHQNSPLLPDLYLAMGTTLYELEQHEAAEKSFQTFLSKFGNHPQVAEVKLRMGLVKMSRDQYESAGKFFQEAAAVKDFPLADFAEVQRGQSLFQQEKYAEAAGVFEGVPKKFPKSGYLADALIAAGKSRFREDKFPEAERALKELLAKHKTSPQVSEGAYWLGQTLRELKRPAEAIKVLDPAIASPSAGEFKPRLEFARLEAQADLPMQEKASLTFFANFAAKYPQHELAFDALYRAARVALTLEDFPNGRKHAAAFLARTESAKHRLWGEVAFIAGECDLLDAKPNHVQAEKFYRELITKFPKHAQTSLARVRVGHCLQARKQYDPAIAWLTESVKHIAEKPLKAECHFLIGRALVEKNQHKPAISAFKLSRQTDPAWPRGDEVLLALAVEWEADQNPQEAMQELSKLISSYPKSEVLPQTLSRLGQLKMEAKKWDEAAGPYRQLVANFPMHELTPFAQYRLGMAYFQKPDHQTTVKELSQLIAKWPKSELIPKARYLRGASYYQLKQHAQVVADLKVYLAANPKEAEQKREAQLTLALALTALKDYRQTAATLEVMLKESPTAAKADQANYELAFAYQKLNDEANAVKAFQHLASKFPDSPLAAEAWFRVGEHHQANKKLDEALKSYQSGLAKVKEPKFKELLLYKIGRVQYDRKAYAEVVTELGKFLKEFPNSPFHDDAVYLQAESYFALNKPAEAFPVFVQASVGKAEKYHARAFYRAGQCASQTQKWADAEKQYQAVVDRFPKFAQLVEARYGLAFAQQNQRKFGPARSHYLQVIKDTETETAARARFMLGECDFAEQKYNTAWEHYLEAALGYPYEEWKVQGRYQAARCYIQLKQADKAREELQHVIEKYPAHALVKDAQKLLKTLP